MTAIRDGRVASARRVRRASGVDVGVILTDILLERAVGDSGNAKSYDFPVAFTTAYGADAQTLIHDKADGLLPIYAEAGRALLDQGVRAISASCGFTAILQPQLADELDGVVATSALLQIPFALRMIASDKNLCVITANANTLDSEHYRAVGISESDQERLHLVGIEHTEYLYPFLSRGDGEVDITRGSQELTEVAHKALEDDTSIAGFILECTGLPPFAGELRDQIGLPIWDIITMISWVQSGFAS